MIMQLRSVHVTLLRTKFQSLNCPPNQTYSTGQPHVGLCPIFLVFDTLPQLVEQSRSISDISRCIAYSLVSIGLLVVVMLL